MCGYIDDYADYTKKSLSRQKVTIFPVEIAQTVLLWLCPADSFSNY